jgi:LemA protein
MVIVAILVLVGVLVLLLWGYNTFARMRNIVRTAWSDIDVYLRRRADLIPNLVDVAKGYAGFERQVLQEVVEARTSALQGELSPRERASKEQALEIRVAKLIALAEEYPELKASVHFANLQSALSETENLIANARRYYNAAVRDYNTLIESFPTNVIARMFGFKKAQFFAVDDEEARQRAPVKFSP